MVRKCEKDKEKDQKYEKNKKRLGGYEKENIKKLRWTTGGISAPGTYDRLSDGAYDLKQASSSNSIGTCIKQVSSSSSMKQASSSSSRATCIKQVSSSNSMGTRIKQVLSSSSIGTRIKQASSSSTMGTRIKQVSSSRYMCCVEGVHSVPDDIGTIAGIDAVAVGNGVAESTSSPRAPKPRPDQLLFGDYELYIAYMTDEFS